MDFSFYIIFFLLAIIGFSFGFIYICLAKIEKLHQQQDITDKEKNYRFQISNLKYEIYKLELEKKINQDQLSIQSQQQAAIEQKNKIESEKLINLLGLQSNEINQLRSLLNQQSFRSYDCNQNNLVQERNSLQAKLDFQIGKSVQMEEQLLEKDRLVNCQNDHIQKLEIILASNEQVLSQLSFENKKLLERLNNKDGQEESIKVKVLESEHLEKERDNECTICYSQMKTIDVSFLGCGHKYCFECILKWSKHCNICPECKERFNIINRGNNVEGVPNNVYVGWKDQDHEPYDDEEDLEDVKLYLGSY
ncbi:hypothetical protein DICPUDRAFT_156246 [Dictyostelium purpureum]|uniref:RING-type domain-containing protein n=1 Tax=Dictyostelium purpureum TaxID=5786 RepID=F0ZW36_DICPU|nr:uncharacterized protein DICPUDRAFT_156246 [Dictyostelium purpureum]EGC31854.1 hypothetical protein DICPUDRAFT_156246 [Dictyostelium purpureum]|eukprot:XP_003291624.1 hypothetical protein DICPUDRAFT_156246 [Dictyostelium purpureum]